MKVTLKFLFAVYILIGFSQCADNQIEINSQEDFEEFLIDEMEFQNIPALSVLIFNKNEVLYEKYLGNSIIETNTILEADHLFLLASISKVITATALLQLFDAGHFELDDDINDYLPFNVSIPNQPGKISFKMLLTHTSGIADGSALDGQYYYEEDSPIALDYFLENYLVPGGMYYNASENFYNFGPGTKHEYSNEGSALIAVLVEQISNQSFQTYCKENIFLPLEMSNTYWSLEEALESNSDLVQPYTFENGQLESVRHYTFTDYPNGGLRSTGSDMFKFLSSFVNEGISNNFQLLSSTTINSMITPQITTIDSEVGLHMFLMEGENNLWGHDGGEEGVSTIMAFNPNTEVGAILFTNQSDVDLDQMLEEAYLFGLMF